MVGVEDLAGMIEIEVVVGEGVPGQREDPLQIGADDAVLGGRLRQALEWLRLPVRTLARPLGELSQTGNSFSS